MGKEVENEQSATSQTQNPVKVLLADDDQDDRELFSDALKEAGIDAELQTVENGEEVIDNLKDPSEPNPDIVFLDMNMPVKDGKQTLKEMKADEDLKEIPTVILSTSDNPKGISDTFKAGASLYVQKPNSFRNFVKLLKTVFSFHHAGKLLRSAWDYFFVSEKHLTGKKS